MADSSGVPASKKCRSSTPSDSVPCASSSSAKVFRDLQNLAFVRIVDELTKLKKYTPKYTLDDLAEYLGVQI